MVAASTDHIVAGESSVVGSIGVIFQYAQAQDLLDKIGVSFEEIKSSPLKAEPSPFHEASEEGLGNLLVEEQARGGGADLTLRRYGADMGEIY